MTLFNFSVKKSRIEGVCDGTNNDSSIHYLPTGCTDYYLFIKYYCPLHVSSIKCSSSGGHSCIQAAYGNIMENSTVYCVMSVCSCFVMILKFCIFCVITHCRIWRGVVMVWRVATLPMSCYIVRKITTRRMPQSYACYLRTSQPLVAL